VLVTFVTAGYPTKNDTVPLLLAMQAGGADIIELGVPFSDPIADGPAIQETNTVLMRFYSSSPIYSLQILFRWP
jgi:tryptophan synthase